MHATEHGPRLNGRRCKCLSGGGIRGWSPRTAARVPVSLLEATVTSAAYMYCDLHQQSSRELRLSLTSSEAQELLHVV